MSTATAAVPETETTILDRVAESFVPPELQAHYYKTLVYLRTLDPNDDLLRIVEAIGFFTYITRQAPTEMSAEREKLKALASEHVRRVEQAMKATAGYHQTLESRLVNLPDEVVKGIDPNVIAGRIGESLRQRFTETELPQTAQMLKATATHMAVSSADLSGALKTFADPQNRAARTPGGTLGRVRLDGHSLDEDGER